MPKPFKLYSARPLPASADLVEYQGALHFRTKASGRTVHYRLSTDGTKYLKPSKCWYFKYPDSTGTYRRMKGFSDLKATEQRANDTECRSARIAVGIIDPAEANARKPLAEHLTDYAAHLFSASAGVTQVDLEANLRDGG